MASTVHYKLKSSSSASGGAASSGGWSTLHFDGVYLSILEFKRKVIYKEEWCKSEADANFDLLVSNSNSGEEYRDDTYSVHRNVSVLVKRIPAASPAAARKLYIPLGSLPADWNKSTSTWVPKGVREANTNLTPLGAGGAGAGEEGDIAAMMQQRGSLAGSRGRAPQGPFQPSFNTRTLTPTSKPPGGYVCHRCKQGGHYIQFCPTNGDHKYDMAQRSNTTREDREREREREKEKVQSHVAYGERDYSEGGGSRGRHGAPAPTPSESAARWLKPVVDPKGLQAELNGGVAPVVEETPAQMKQRMFPSQFFAASAGSTVAVTNPTLAPHDPHAERLAAYARAVAESAPSAAAAAPAPAAPLRPDLTCSLCGDYFASASVLGCCYTSFCLECIQQHLQKTGACPSCASSDVTVADLQPNANLQKAVDAFLLEHPSIVRGAIKQQKAMAAAAAANPVQTPVAPAPAPSSYPSNGGSDRRSDDRDSRGGSSSRRDDRGRSRSRSRDRDHSYPSASSTPLLPASAAYPGAAAPLGAPWMQQPGMPMAPGAYGMMPPYGAYGMQMQMPYGMPPQMGMGGGGYGGMHPMQMQMQQQYAAAGGANGYPMQTQQMQQQQPPPHQGRHRSRSRSRERDHHRR